MLGQFEFRAKEKEEEEEEEKYKATLTPEKLAQYLIQKKKEEDEKREAGEKRAAEEDEKYQIEKKERQVVEDVEADKEKDKFIEMIDKTDKNFVTKFMQDNYTIKKKPFKLDGIYYIIDKNASGRYVPIRKKCIKINGENICSLCNDPKNLNDTDECVEIDDSKKEVWTKTDFGIAFGKSATTYKPPVMKTLKELLFNWRQNYRSNKAIARDRAGVKKFGGKTKNKRKHYKSKRKQSKRRGKSRRKGKTGKTRRHYKK